PRASGPGASDLAAPDWQLVAELIETSYRLTASKSLVRELDASRRGASETSASNSGTDEPDQADQPA
ncbi:MAG: hypothetical protein ACTH31_07195, partial [Pseudoclavibacter sp.]